MGKFVIHANKKGICWTSFVCSLLLLYASSVKNKTEQKVCKSLSIIFFLLLSYQVKLHKESAFSEKINNLDFGYKLMKSYLHTFDNPLFIRLCSVQCNIFAARIIIIDIALQARSKVLYFWYDKCNYRCKIITL